MNEKRKKQKPKKRPSTNEEFESWVSEQTKLLEESMRKAPHLSQGDRYLHRTLFEERKKDL